MHSEWCFVVSQHEVAAGPPVFLLLVDTSMLEKELQGIPAGPLPRASSRTRGNVDLCSCGMLCTGLKDSLTQIMQLIPQTALVGLVTFGTTVQVRRVGSGRVGRIRALPRGHTASPETACRVRPPEAA